MERNLNERNAGWLAAGISFEERRRRQAEHNASMGL
jgi:hypothetical protein